MTTFRAYPFLHFFALTHFRFFLTNPFLHFFLAMTAVGELLPFAAAMAELAGSASAPIANRSVTPKTLMRGFQSWVFPLLGGSFG